MVPGVGSVTFRKLVNTFHTPEHALSASFSDLKHIPGIQEKLAREIAHFGFPDHVKRELDDIETHQVQIITWDDREYPEHLNSIFDPPPVLYVKGTLCQQQELLIAVVGCRKASTYGRTMAGKLSTEFAMKGVTVVSGMARGIDSAAHVGSLKAGGRTIAVLGCGVNVIYPPENKRLYHEIVEKGAVISEFPIHAKPDRFNFPARNRIISGMTLGTVIVEAGHRSGALITADMALEQGREVFAVPGNVTSGTSAGTNHLIKQGAYLIEHAEDVLSALSLEISREIKGAQPEFAFNDPTAAPPAHKPDLTQEEQHLFDIIPPEQPIHIDDITVRSELPSGKVSAMLMMLEMKNVIRQLSGKMFVRT